VYAAISEQLQAYLRQHGRTVLTITLKPIRCCGSTVFEVLVDPHAPKHLDRYASFVQDGLCIYYSPQLGRRSELLELDYVRTLFRSKPVMTGPEDLVASVLVGHL
jgi:hypothetical protein